MIIENIKEKTMNTIIVEMKKQLMENKEFVLDEDKLLRKLNSLNSYKNALSQCKLIEFDICKNYSNGSDRIMICVLFRKEEYSTLYRTNIHYSIKEGLPIEYLKTLISDIINDDKIPCNPWLTDIDFIEELPKAQQDKINKVIELAGDLICTNNQCPDMINYKILSEEGIKISAGEKDSFGWLSAKLLTEKGTICIG